MPFPLSFYAVSAADTEDSLCHFTPCRMVKCIQLSKSRRQKFNLITAKENGATKGVAFPLLVQKLWIARSGNESYRLPM